MRIGLGTGSRRDLRPAGAGGRERRSPSAAAVEQRFLEWPYGPTQDEVKELEHEADRIVSELLSQTNSLFVTPYDRDDLIDARLRGRRRRRRERERRRALRPLRVETPTKQAIELCGLLVRATERPRVAAREAQGPARLVRRDPRDQGDRGPGRRHRPRRAREPLQGRPHRPGDRDPLEGHLRGAGGRGRRLRDRRASRRQHPRQERVARPRRLSPPGARRR